MRDLDTVAVEWAREQYERFENDDLTWARLRELYEALRPEAREALRAFVCDSLENLQWAVGEDLMPLCEFRFVRFVAQVVDRELEDRVQAQSPYIVDGAWNCDCDVCLGFVSRVEAGARRVKAALEGRL